ncbi:MAG TPA: DUF4185 domain-containing protein [Dehalococcoidia bacterium]|nr:DUF4185 domain-containing protein [Dehalococcoidia bacterium]
MALFALAALALAACRAGDASTVAPTPSGNAAPDVVSSRLVCRLIAGNPSAAAATITGVDGTQSLRVGDTDYWFFGDTVRKGPDGRQDVTQASVATSSDFDGSDCVDLKFKTAGGVAQPLFPTGDETTAWPDGVLAFDDGSIVFYMVRAIRTSPFAWHVGSVGLGRIPAGSVDGQRTVDTIWDENSGFGSRVTGARSPVRVGGDVIVFLDTEAGGNYAARAPITRLADPNAYTYWDGSGWSPSPAKAAPMWPVETSGVPADNGISVSRDPTTGKWLAVYNQDLATIDVRTSDNPWGPWSAPKQWLDCRPLVGRQYPYCYSAELHRELSTNATTLYLTFSGQDPYDVSLMELKTKRP